MIGTDLAFEKSEVEASVTTRVISIKNPLSGHIYVPCVDEIVHDDADCHEIVLYRKSGEGGRSDSFESVAALLLSCIAKAICYTGYIQTIRLSCVAVRLQPGTCRFLVIEGRNQRNDREHCVKGAKSKGRAPGVYPQELLLSG